MANKGKNEEYISKAKVNSIKFTSRASVCVDKNYYTVEACEERIIPDIEDIDIEKEKELLWDSVNKEVDSQVYSILEMYRKK